MKLLVDDTANIIKAWIAKGATPTDRVLRHFAEQGLMTRDPRNNPQKAQPGKKAQERAAERAKKSEAGAGGSAEAAAAE